MREVVIVSACRTAIGAFGGTLRDMHAATISSVPMKAAVERAGISPDIIDDVRFGCCLNPTDAMNVTRIGALMAGIPESVPAVTINRVCISGMEAVLSGYGDDQGRGCRRYFGRRRRTHVRGAVHSGTRSLGRPNG